MYLNASWYDKTLVLFTLFSYSASFFSRSTLLISSYIDVVFMPFILYGLSLIYMLNDKSHGIYDRVN